jgi:hypothetical protein
MSSPYVFGRERFPCGKFHLNKNNWSGDLNIFFLDAFPPENRRFDGS